ncbi:phage/plasmid primase, P4 family [Natranaerofaba carboxydovora]|uniref:phage/plasmid primase, P4 family n=1 Tax=Natranaerofaba carboxydovora TaxID=2742683 RepID=UPI001F1392FE|nr:phage/plasmid primase, P4 family [Natranaerofaba carboxydovora]UMZ72554.1 hypothetical protein ACONDI_00075 [Natranaerofaba carboxydovora]
MKKYVKDYLNSGYSIIPINPKSKTPIIEWKEYQNKRPSEEELIKWWRKWPNANIGIVTGKISGIFVLDVDGKEGEKSLDGYELPDTAVAETGGGGRHYFFEHPGFICKNFTGILPNVDIRGDGGYIVAPPSLHESGNKYKWLNKSQINKAPEWLLEKLNSVSKTYRKITAEDFAKEIKEGARNNELTSIAGSLLGHGVSLEETLTILKSINQTNCCPPLPEKEVEKIAESIAKREYGNDHMPVTKNNYNYDVSRFFDGSTFIPKKVANEITTNYSIIKAYGKLYYYQDGIYREGGEELIRRKVRELLDDKAKNNRVNEVLQHIKDTSNQVSDFHPHPEYINVTNGRLNWHKDNLEEHNPEIFELMQLPVQYNPEADCPRFKGFLNEVLDDEVISLIQEMFGLTIAPDITENGSKKFHKMFILTGEGRNGKSVLLSTLETLLGRDNVSNISLQELEHNRFKKADLLGKLANIFGDIDSKSLNSTSAIKTLTGGDTIAGERKNEHHFYFKNYAELIFSANELPKANDKSKALYKRLIIVPFERTFSENEADKNLLSKLTTDEELSGILNWAIEGRKRLFQKGSFTISHQVEALLEKYKQKNNNALEFLNKFVVEDTDGIISKSDLYQKYHTWCEENNIIPESQQSFNQTIKENFNAKEYKPGSIRLWRGIAMSEI